MQAAFYTITGKPDVIRYADFPTPEPGAGEVRVQVEAASVNPIDTYTRAGLVGGAVLPAIVGRDFAGVVESVGAGVTQYRVGDRVWGANQNLPGRPGTFAEFTVAGEEWVQPLPDGVGFPEAAAVALTGITAHLGLFWCANLQAGETVFVNGGTGGVGSLVVQMAKAVGANVITTAGSAEKVAQARSLGADVAINYKTENVAEAVKAATHGAGISVWYETLPPTDLEQTFQLMAKRGRVVVMAGRAAQPVFPNGLFYVKNLSLFGFAMFNADAAEQRRCALDINRWLVEKKLRPIIGKVVKFSEAAAAHQLQEENTLHKAGTLIGKIVAIPG
ncbi:MAG: NADPH:quinone reductase [Bacteroidales bacterium]|nr:NADPH:quinone reductase [Bacteroidales bacterium]